MEFGEIVPQPQEAETIRSIYLQYLAGASFKQLTEQLQAEDVPYDVDKPWNKNMVARILEDDRYIGEKYFPALIPNTVGQGLITKAFQDFGRGLRLAGQTV